MVKKPEAGWGKSVKSVKATQIAFEMEQQIAAHIRELAVKEGLTPSDQIRKMLGLSFSPPKRPRLTVTLSQEDYETLGKKYKLAPSDSLSIKRRMMEDLARLTDAKKPR